MRLTNFLTNHAGEIAAKVGGVVQNLGDKVAGLRLPGPLRAVTQAAGGLTEKAGDALVGAGQGLAGNA